jgi:hypothetical protein
MGAGDEPRCCVLLHTHMEMTDLSDKPLRFDLTGVCGCRGEQLFDFGGRVCDAGMGFMQCESGKSRARNELEMAMRMLPIDGGPRSRTPEGGDALPTPAALRELWVRLCRDRMEETAPLLTDVVLRTAMTEDFRERSAGGEEEVRTQLLADLDARLRQQWYFWWFRSERERVCRFV